jgi:hypothetical protein
MVEKILLATTLTVSLNLFLGLRVDSTKPTSMLQHSQPTPTIIVSLLANK